MTDLKEQIPKHLDHDTRIFMQNLVNRVQGMHDNYCNIATRLQSCEKSNAFSLQECITLEKTINEKIDHCLRHVDGQVAKMNNKFLETCDHFEALVFDCKSKIETLSNTQRLYHESNERASKGHIKNFNQIFLDINKIESLTDDLVTLVNEEKDLIQFNKDEIKALYISVGKAHKKIDQLKWRLENG